MIIFTVMDLALKKIELIEWLTKVNDESLIQKVDKLKRQTLKEAYEAKLTPMSSDEYANVLQQAESDYKHGRVTSQEDFEKESDNW